jgi:hypothetical protein
VNEEGADQMIKEYKEIGAYFLDADLSILGENPEIY